MKPVKFTKREVYALAAAIDMWEVQNDNDEPLDRETAETQRALNRVWQKIADARGF